ncbi:MAG: hypothetical protein M3132_01870 [Actinomycetia bacterium]|nr:hypothetical protein [Actinomycetes bacterium]
MGQRIEIEDEVVVDDSIILSTDRSLTSADGEGYGSADEATDSGTFAGGLASDLFESSDVITRVYVASNVVVVQRKGGWSADATASTRSIIEEFFLYYPAV